jgi:flagellar protein FliT
MNSQELMSIYENVANITDQMLRAAQASNWDLLVKLEASCSAQTQAIKENTEQVQLASADRENKIRIIKKILSDDAQIRDLVHPRMKHISDLMRTSSSQRRLTKAYQLDHRTR